VPRYLIHDRDHAFESVGATAKAMGIDEVLTAPRAPWQNAFVERLVGSARRESFDHVIVFHEAGVRKLIARYCLGGHPNPAINRHRKTSH
jgi:transposase InsO family protein